MRKEIKSLAVAVLGLAAVACASPEKMAEMAESVTVTCDPSPLEVVAGKIDATVSVTYPADYFHPKAILEVTPVLVYEGGEATMAPFMYQGEKVKDNYTVVSSDGQTVTEKVHFEYVKGMEQSHLELRGVVKYKKKSIDLPIKKVADGANTTYMLVGYGEGLGKVAYKADNYQEVIPQSAEGQILYTINSADVRSKELKSASIKDFQAALDEIKNNERKTLKSTEVVAYASPDGGQELNAKLSDKRSKSADKAWSKVVKGKEVTDPEVKSVGQDWEGFQELVAASNLQDKDLILRVLSMYKDPQEREQQIRNMSAGFKELADGILPELRRSRLIINYETIGRSDEQIKDQYKNDATQLSVDELLYSATLNETPAKQEEIYKKTAEVHPNDYRAFNNLAALALAKGDKEAAQKYAAKAAQLGSETPEAQANLGLVSLINGNVQDAERAISKGANSENVKAAIGALNIAKGNYAQAERDFGNTLSNTAALAQLLNKNYDAAAKTLDKVENHNAMTDYLHAIVAARRGNKFAAASYLKEALQKDPSLKQYADNDLELKLLK